MRFCVYVCLTLVSPPRNQDNDILRLYWVPKGVQGPLIIEVPQTIQQCRSPNNSALKVPKHVGFLTVEWSGDLKCPLPHKIEKF